MFGIGLTYANSWQTLTGIAGYMHCKCGNLALAKTYFCMQKVVLLCAAMAFTLLANCQNKKGNFRVLHSPLDIDIQPLQNTQAKKTCQVYATEKEVAAIKNIWGYQLKNGEVYRKYLDDFVKLEVRTGHINIYSKNGKGFRGRTITTYFFSKGLFSAVYSLNKENIDNQYKHDVCFLQRVKRELKWPYDYSYWDNKTNSFKIVNILKECEGG
jgi:hypothetical protein